MLTVKRLSLTLALSLGLGAPLALAPAAAQASTRQVALFEEDQALASDPMGTMQTIHQLGAGMVRVDVDWAAVAPDSRSTHKPSFDATNPNAYPAVNWGVYDRIVQAARIYHMQLDFLITGGAPFWADGRGMPAEARNRMYAWKPTAGAYGDFVKAVSRRYGSYVHEWELWNEPNFGEDLAPQATNGSRVLAATQMYRGLVDAGWSALHATGHGHDTIVVGQLAARGMSGRATSRFPEGLPGNFAQTKPLQFIRALYCVDGSYRPLRGRAASSLGCPTNNAGTRAFAGRHPGLFRSSGFGIHPYPQGLPPTQEASHDPDFVAFSEIPRLERTLDRTGGVYGSHRHLAIYNNEYGYVTHPPASGAFASPTKAALYLNWAEYLSWKNPRIATWMQFLLRDPVVGGPSQFFSGLESQAGVPKQPVYDAYRLPLFLPSSTVRHGKRLLVWGAVRPEPAFSGSRVAQIQYAPHTSGPWRNLASVTVTAARGYFTSHVLFPGSGFVRLAWTYPGGPTAYSRDATVSVR